MIEKYKYSSKVLLKAIPIIFPLLLFLFLLLQPFPRLLILPGSPRSLVHKPQANPNHLLSMPIGAQSY